MKTYCNRESGSYNVDLLPEPQLQTLTPKRPQWLVAHQLHLVSEKGVGVASIGVSGSEFRVSVWGLEA